MDGQYSEESRQRLTPPSPHINNVQDNLANAPTEQRVNELVEQLGLHKNRLLNDHPEVKLILLN